MVMGITGTLGAGKGTVVDYLIKNKGFRHYSVREFISEEIRKKGLPVNRDNMVKVANELRRLHGPSYIVDCLYDQAKKEGSDSIIESIRTTGEIDSLRGKGAFILLSVDADPEVRYQRIIQRNSETDHITYETFLLNEQREMNGSDPGRQNLQACMKEADYHITNSGTVAELYLQVEDILGKIKEYE